jgi:isoleucyl-tRNA synthetase
VKAKDPIVVREWAKECALEQIEIQKKQFRSWGIMGDWDKAYRTMGTIAW